VDTPIPILRIVGFKRLEHSQFNPGSVSVFLHGSDDFNCNALVSLAIPSFDDLAEGSLSKKTDDLIYPTIRHYYRFTICGMGKTNTEK
jgi:hypothetical protein